MSQFTGPKDAITVSPGPSLSDERCRELREELRQLVSAGRTNIILDLRETTEITSRGIYLLLAARHTLQAVAGGRLTLVNLVDGPRELLAGLHLLDEALDMSA